MSEWSYIIAAYGATWILFGGYAAYLALRARRVARTLPPLRGGR